MSDLIVNQSKYAKHLGKSRQYVNSLVKDGKIKLNEDGLIDVVKADFDLKRHKDPARELALPLDDEPKDTDKNAENFASHRATRESYQARLVRLEYEEKVGQLVRRKDVEDAMVSGARRVREGHQLIPTWADEIFAMVKDQEASVDDVKRFLKTKVRAMDQGIADNLALDGEGGEDG